MTTIAAQEVGAGSFHLDPTNSTVRYSSKHMFGLGTVHAEFSVTSGELRIAETLASTSVHVTIDAASFVSGNARRDRDVKSRPLLDVATYPDIRFSSTAVHDTGEGAEVEGSVTAHGTTVPVHVAVSSITGTPSALRIQARAARLDRYDFGITGSKGLVGRYFDLDLDVLALRD